MSDYNPRGFISSSSFRTCGMVALAIAAVAVFVAAFVAGVIVGKAL